MMEDVGVGIELVSLVTKVVVGNDISQNFPVHPAKHLHTARSSIASHSPFMQLTVSHTKMLAVVGDGVGSIDVREGNGTMKLSKLEISTRSDDTEVVSD